MKVYLDNSATTKPCKKSIKRANHVFKKLYGNPSSIHAEGIKAKEELERSRRIISECLNCSSEEIIFTSGGTESDNQVINFIEKYGERVNKKHIIASPFEHPAIDVLLQRLSLKGFEITYLSVDETGVIKIEDFKREIRKDTVFATVMWVNNEIGTIQPIEEIANLCNERHILFHTDAVQAVGHVSIDLHSIPITFLAASAHKFRGIRGAGFLFCRKAQELIPTIYGGGQENGNRSGTENLPAISAMAEALKENCKHLENRNKKIYNKREYFLSSLENAIENISLNGSHRNRVEGNINIVIEEVDAETLLSFLSEKGIYVSTGSACHSYSLTPSKTLTAIGRNRDQALSSIRITIDENITKKQIDYCVKVMKEVVEYLRSFNK